MKVWHPRMRKIWPALAVTASAAWVGLWILAIKRIPELANPTTGEANGVGALLLVVGLLLAMLSVLLGAMALFPDPVFRIGYGVARHDRVKNVRSNLGWALLATCVLGPLFGFLMKLIA